MTSLNPIAATLDLASQDGYGCILPVAIVSSFVVMESNLKNVESNISLLVVLRLKSAAC